MPNYLGVEQADLVQSIADALELLETHSTGPECQKLIDGLRATDPATGVSKLGAIANAGDDVTLANAVSASGVNWLFICAREVLQLHALCDTDGKGFDVLARLEQWNASGGARFMAYYPIDGEVDSWLAANYARGVAAEERTGKIAEVLPAFAQSPAETTAAGAAIAKLLDRAEKGADDEELKKLFLDLDLRERHIVKGTLMAVALEGMEPLNFENPMGRFGVVIDDLTNRKINWHDKSLEAVRKQVEEVLMPFYATDEVNMTGIGLITMPQSRDENEVIPQGIIFGSSKRAAQAVANALPDMKIMDGQGRIIAPQAKPQPPKPGFTL